MINSLPCIFSTLLIKRSLLTIFLTALVLRITYSISLYFSIGMEAFLVEDSALYVQLASNFVSQADFVRAIGNTGQYIDETERMPLYTIWLALHQLIASSSNVLFPALTQGILDSVACILIAQTGALMDRRLLFPVGLVAAFNPTQIIVSNMILTDSMFFFFVCLMFYASAKWLINPKINTIMLLGLAVGFGLSTRVIMLPILPALVLFLPIALIFLKKYKFALVLHLFLFLIIALAIQAPIITRNINTYDSINLTSQGGTHSMLWVAPLILEAKNGTPHKDGAKQIQARYERHTRGAEPNNPFVRSKLMSSVAWQYITDLGWEASLKAWAIGAAINIFSPAIILSPEVSNLPRTGFFETTGETKIDKVTNFLFNNDNNAYALILIISSIALISMRILQMLGIIHSMYVHRNREFYVILFFILLWLVYILLVNGPIASPKYRLPIEPVTAIFSGFGILQIITWWQKRGIH